MSKAERLFHLVTLLRARRTSITAEAIAEVMEVSVRTVYRDLQALSLSGVPIAGEPGIGYLLRRDYQLPPLMLSPEEVLALLVGGRMVQAFTDPELARAARQAEQKIRSILPEDLKHRAENQPYRIPVAADDDPLRELHGKLRVACEQHIKIRVAYMDGQQQQTERILYPLAMVGWSDRWTLLAWCELRGDYRNFRFDRFLQVDYTEESFALSETMCIAHYFQSALGFPDRG